MTEFLTYFLASYNVWFTAPLVIVFLFALFRLATGQWISVMQMLTQMWMQI